MGVRRRNIIIPRLPLFSAPSFLRSLRSPRVHSGSMNRPEAKRRPGIPGIPGIPARHCSSASSSAGNCGVGVDGTDDPLLQRLDLRVGTAGDAVHHDREGVPVAVLGVEQAAEGADAFHEPALAQHPPPQVTHVGGVKSAFQRPIHAGEVYSVLQRLPDWELMATQRSMIFGLEEAQGYNPAQLPRYWTFNRAVDPKPMRYNATGYIRAEPVALDLLQVAYLIQPRSDPPAVPGETPVAFEGEWVLYRLPNPPPRASVLTSWTLVPSPSRALAAVTSPGFDPAHEVVLEHDPHPGTEPQPASASGGSATTVVRGR